MRCSADKTPKATLISIELIGVVLKDSGLSG